MLRFRDASRPEIINSLRRGDFRLWIGDTSLRLTCGLPELADGLVRLYGHYRVSVTGGPYDYDLEVNPASWWRQWFRRNALFRFSGQAPFLPMAADHAHAMFEWGLNWVIGGSTHQCLILHSAVVEKNGKGIMLAAESGSGKSTLTAELVMRGWRLFSDEIALISIPSLALKPFPRPISLKNDSIRLIQDRHPDAVVGPLARDTQKGTIAHLKAPDESVDRAEETVQPSLIVFPKWTAGTSLDVVAVGQGQAAMRLIDQSFNYPVLGREGFSVLADLVQAAQAWGIAYSELDDAVAVLDDLISGYD